MKTILCTTALITAGAMSAADSGCILSGSSDDPRTTVYASAEGFDLFGAEETELGAEMDLRLATLDVSPAMSVSTAPGGFSAMYR